MEAELYFMNNYNSIDIFKDGNIEDARLYGDGYNVNEKNLAEVKEYGLKEIRLTEMNISKQKEYQNDYIITLVLNLDDLPTF